jgi:hypothetical protein
MPSDFDMLLLNRFLLGMLVMACAVVGAFFLRFWRKTRDRLFLIFALAFWLLGLNWGLLAFVQTDETRTWLYVLRLVAFCLIIYGIVDKNRQRTP